MWPQYPESCARRAEPPQPSLALALRRRAGARRLGLTVTELISAERRQSPVAVGYYRLRPPVKPITLAELASLPKSDAERRAVER